ncbi:MAG: PDZ domain-containing protein, partial [Gemmatimonadota bacterium]
LPVAGAALLALTLAATLAAPAAAQEPERVWIRPAMAGGWIGISFEPGRRAEGAQRPVVVITRVVEGSPAEAAGLEVGDTLLSVNGLAASEELIGSLAASLSPGDEVDVLVRRAGGERRIALTAGERPAAYVALSPSMGIVSFQTDSIMGRVRILMDSAAHSLSIRRLPEVMVERLPSRSLGRLGVQLDTIRTHLMEIFPDSSNFNFRLRVLSGDSTHRVFTADSMADRFRGMLRVQRDSMMGDSAHFRVFSQSWVSDQDPGSVRVFFPDSARHFEGTLFERAAPSWRFFGERAVAGAHLQEVSGALAEALELGADEGLLVLEVPDATPAYRADLRSGDLIVSAAGRGVATVAELRRAIERAPRDEPVVLEVLRKRQRVRVTLPRD